MALNLLINCLQNLPVREMIDKVKRAVLVLLLSLLLLVSFAFAADEEKILGLWNTPENDCKIQIFKSGTKYCGRIVWLKEPLYPADDDGGMASRPIVDRENPNPNLRSRTLIGLQLMEGFTYIGRNIWGKGTIYNPDNGKTYKCKMILSGLNRLDVRGFIAIPLLGATSIWTRQAESPVIPRDYFGYQKHRMGANWERASIPFLPALHSLFHRKSSPLTAGRSSLFGEVAKFYYQPAPKISKKKFHLVLPEMLFFNSYPSMQLANKNQQEVGKVLQLLEEVIWNFCENRLHF